MNVELAIACFLAEGALIVVFLAVIAALLGEVVKELKRR